ncbi:hypothetical protein [Cryptosporangium phraense]|uniref:Uncharacterized protein n=1 Tax=Cryptosporangium phraense TaxID=2593070 RepID=A0A545ALC2_9ACTN|nr:hypothetical protein [Cryptosporangium phraense]TQS42119.1 hypothetical protein FL583_26390 [Cryptosporangium phraense]
MRATKAVTTAVAVGVTGWAARRLLTRRAARNTPAAESSRWRFVTVNVTPDRVRSDGQLPEPLRALGPGATVVVRPAPADKGTEIGVRLVEGEPTGAKAAAERFTGEDPRQAVRVALRDAKQLLETGEILFPDRPGTTKPTLRGKPLEAAIAHAKGEGKS